MPSIPGETTRQRIFSTDVQSSSCEGKAGYPPNYSVNYSGSRPLKINGGQITVSEGHPFNSLRRPKGQQGKLQDVGGAFFTQRKYIANGQKFPKYTQVVNAPGFNGFNRITTFKFPGTGFPSDFPETISPAQFPEPHTSSDKELEAWGAKAISICKPTNSPANVSTAIAEIMREGLPSLPVLNTLKSKGSPANKVGDELLNYQFGVAPVISDAKKFVSAVSNMDKLLAQFEADAGKVVRRKYYFPIERDVTEKPYSNSGGPPWGTLPFNGVNQSGFTSNEGEGCIVRTEVITRRWFSGAFTYNLPMGMDSRKKIGELALRADRLGLELTPETLWNLTPWSWAVDWFTNAGDVLSNYSAWAKYGLILHYGYIMEHVKVSRTYSRTNVRSMPDEKPVRLPSTTLVTETKRRLKANPFGFGVTFEGLSDLQLAILASLGMTRGSR